MYIYLIMKLKIIKSLLIPTLGITLSATTISSLTSCTNNSEIKKYYLIGGSVQLNGAYGNDWRDNNSWKLLLDGKRITQGITWKIEDIYKNSIDGISINNGTVSWSGNIAAGEYNFFVIATYDEWEIKSAKIKLTII